MHSEGKPTPGGRWKRIAWAAAALPAVALSGCNFGAAPGSDVQGTDIANLYHLLFWVSIPIAVLVYGLILWSVIRYRKRDDREPPQIRENLPIEVAYTLIPVLIVGFLFWQTYRTEVKVDHVSGDPVVVDVTAFQWQWTFHYPQGNVTIYGTANEYPTMVVPAGETVQVDLRSEDVVHSFYVPDFLFKRQAIPGVLNRFDLTIPKPGKWRGQCADFCGLDHASMVFYVQAVPPAQYQQWLAQQAAAQGTVASQ